MQAPVRPRGRMQALGPNTRGSAPPGPLFTLRPAAEATRGRGPALGSRGSCRCRCTAIDPGLALLRRPCLRCVAGGAEPRRSSSHPSSPLLESQCQGGFDCMTRCHWACRVLRSRKNPSPPSYRLSRRSSCSPVAQQVADSTVPQRPASTRTRVGA